LPICFVCGELPRHWGVLPGGLPGGELASEFSERGDAAVETLASQNGKLNLCNVEPATVLWSVVDFESLCHPASLLGWECLVEAGSRVRVQVVHDQDNAGSSRVCIENFLHKVGEV